MNTQKIFSRILDVLILVVFMLFFASAGFQDNRTSGWYQQFFPNLNGSTIKDITFLDSLTGFAVTNTNSSLQAYILKTTNGGDNWNINYTYSQSNTNWYFVKIGFVDSNTGFAFGWTEMFKTTNGGNSWNTIINNLYAEDISIINKDTMLAAKSNGLNGGVYRSTNGGLSWTNIWTGGSVNPEKIYMYDKNLGFIRFSSYPMQRTTNGGFNWTIVNGEFFSGMQFIDSLIGWKTYGGIQKTTNGGLNWFIQQLPNISNSYINSNLDIVSKDTVWMVGAEKWYKAPIYKTTNGGLNWGYQIPDTTIPIYSFDNINFTNSKIGWAGNGLSIILFHTKIGGDDTTYITNINSNVNVELSDYQLFQNYPNPFNAISKIKYKILKSSNVRIEVMNILGKNIQTFVNKKQSPGTYEINFNGENLGSGIYFYSMIIDGKVVDTKRMILLK